MRAVREACFTQRSGTAVQTRRESYYRRYPRQAPNKHRHPYISSKQYVVTKKLAKTTATTFTTANDDHLRIISTTTSVVAAAALHSLSLSLCNCTGDPVLHAGVHEVGLHLLPEPQDQPLPHDPGHSGQGRHARRHHSLLHRRQAYLSLHVSQSCVGVVSSAFRFSV